MKKALQAVLYFAKRKVLNLVKNFLDLEIHLATDHIKDDLHVKSHEELANEINAVLVKHLGEKAQLTQEEMASLSNDVLAVAPDVDKVIDQVIAKVVERIKAI